MASELLRHRHPVQFFEELQFLPDVGGVVAEDEEVTAVDANDAVRQLGQRLEHGDEFGGTRIFQLHGAGHGGTGIGKQLPGKVDLGRAFAGGAVGGDGFDGGVAGENHGDAILREDGVEHLQDLNAVHGGLGAAMDFDIRQFRGNDRAAGNVPVYFQNLFHVHPLKINGAAGQQDFRRVVRWLIEAGPGGLEGFGRRGGAAAGGQKDEAGGDEGSKGFHHTMIFNTGGRESLHG